ncbi:unannotated protein [freshwater metagenome]|uniref:Unannotated protein n=1 Tax=freshwater metagenome TaxID=449393 RepID=A0A6J7LND9_9ZZZZ
MVASFAESEILTANSSTAGFEVAAIGSIELALKVIIGTPVVTAECTVVEPPNTDWVVIKSLSTPTASVIIPELVLTATRAAISLPLADEVISKAFGFLSAIICASPSAIAATPNLSQSPLAVITLSTGKVFSCATISPGFAAKTTAIDSPIFFAKVASSMLALAILPPE